MLPENGLEKYKLRFTEDVTQQRQTEEQLRHAQKMEALGQLTGGLAHDFNNPLAVIIGNLDLLIQAGAIDAEKDELVREALDAALNGGELTRRLLAFARRAALTELESRGRVDLVFTDVVLPGDMDGCALARQVAARYPHINILLTSGFPGTSLPGADELGTSVRLLSKPYRKDELTAAANEALAVRRENAAPSEPQREPIL
jgi:signal transduction histidine kinase